MDVLAIMMEHRYCVMQAQSVRETLEQLKKKKPGCNANCSTLKPENGFDGYITKPVKSKELLEPKEKIFKARA